MSHYDNVRWDCDKCGYVGESMHEAYEHYAETNHQGTWKGG